MPSSGSRTHSSPVALQPRSYQHPSLHLLRCQWQEKSRHYPHDHCPPPQGSPHRRRDHWHPDRQDLLPEPPPWRGHRPPLRRRVPYKHLSSAGGDRKQSCATSAPRLLPPPRTSRSACSSMATSHSPARVPRTMLSPSLESQIKHHLAFASTSIPRTTPATTNLTKPLLPPRPSSLASSSSSYFKFPPYLWPTLSQWPMGWPARAPPTSPCSLTVRNRTKAA